MENKNINYKGYSKILNKWIIGSLLIIDSNYYIVKGIENYIVDKNTIAISKGKE